LSRVKESMMDYEDPDWDSWRIDSLIEARLRRNPDCRDPEHPGCELCEGGHDDPRDGEQDS